MVKMVEAPSLENYLDFFISSVACLIMFLSFRKGNPFLLYLILNKINYILTDHWYSQNGLISLLLISCNYIQFFVQHYSCGPILMFLTFMQSHPPLSFSSTAEPVSLLTFLHCCSQQQQNIEWVRRPHTNKCQNETTAEKFSPLFYLELVSSFLLKLQFAS